MTSIHLLTHQNRRKNMKMGILKNNFLISFLTFWKDLTTYMYSVTFKITFVTMHRTRQAVCQIGWVKVAACVWVMINFSEGWYFLGNVVSCWQVIPTVQNSVNMPWYLFSRVLRAGKLINWNHTCCLLVNWWRIVSDTLSYNWFMNSIICVGTMGAQWVQLYPGLCSNHESWVKFDSTLTQMSRVRVESAVKIRDMSRVRVESRWLSFESELSHLDTAWVKVESLIFRRENVKILQLSVTLQRKNQPTATFDRNPPPPPVNNFFTN